MRNSIFMFFAGLLFILLIDGVVWYQIKQYLRKKWQLILFCTHTLFFVLSLVAFQLLLSHLKSAEAYFWIGKLLGLLFLCYAPKLIFILFNGIGQIFRKISPVMALWISRSSGILAGLLFLILLYSLTWERYNFKTEVVYVPINHLPDTFRDFRIVQLSDLHLGSLGESYKGIDKLVREVNDLHPDLIVFTGDMVNNFANEMLHWIPILKELKAPLGKYAVTGNHDYGDYTHWPDQEAKQLNLRDFFRNMQDMGFHMLNNGHIPLVIGQDTLWLAGVENWGNPPFPRYGNLSGALAHLRQDQPVILLSHDPSHWRTEVIHNNIPLTLSGHTHAMQLGVKIGQWKWSPAQYLYPEYDGLYNAGHQYLHVNRGQGFVGYPGRIGLRPVITEIILIPGENRK